jgi:hypothetical protein
VFLRIDLCNVQWFFNKKLTPLLWGAITLSFLVFFMILYMLDAPRGGLQVLFGHQKQQSPPLAAIF